MLLMKKVFFDAIRSGTKTTTLRYWRRKMVRPGSVHSVRGLGQLRIDDLHAIDADDLTDTDAMADGLAGRDELTSLLHQLYTPDQRSQRTLYKVTFTYLGSPTPNTAGKQ